MYGTSSKNTKSAPRAAALTVLPPSAGNHGPSVGLFPFGGDGPAQAGLSFVTASIT